MAASFSLAAPLTDDPNRRPRNTPSDGKSESHSRRQDAWKLPEWVTDAVGAESMVAANEGIVTRGEICPFNEMDEFSHFNLASIYASNVVIDLIAVCLSV